MAYEVLARKWRPKQFDDVVGQEHVTKTLSNAIESGRIAHAYLFIGPRGIGKTTLSRIFAKALSCEKGPTIRPCDACESCRAITQGNSLDVVEIDGASNNKVEDAQAVLEQVKYPPTHGRFKIFIVDEVHMLTTAAFNALLKTLEEPPPYVKFIFATTEGDKVLPTIISRCQRFDLRRIQTGQIVRRLAQICTAEHVEISQDALLAVARGAEGGMRDALSALDQLISFKGTSLTEEDVLSVFGLVSRQSLEALANAILKGEIPIILKQVDFYESAGKDLRRLLAELMTYFRNLLVYSQGGADFLTADVTDEQLKVFQQQVELSDTKRILSIAGQLADLETKLRQSLSVRTLLEMGLIRCARQATVVSIDSLLRQIASLRESLAQGPVGAVDANLLPAEQGTQVTETSQPYAQAEVTSSTVTNEPSAAAHRAAVYQDETVRAAITMFDGRVVESGH